MYNCFLEYLKLISRLDGDIIEVGVHKGRSLSLIENITKNFNIDKTIWGVDTFEGMPNTVIDGLDNGHDDKGRPTPGSGGHFPGDFRDTSIEYVSRIVAYPNVKLVKGIFPQCSSLVLSDKFCFAHVDVDIYQSYKDTYYYLWPRMVSGGVIICGDDYPCPWLLGAKKAIDEAVEKFGVVPIISPKGQHIIIKP